MTALRALLTPRLRLAGRALAMSESDAVRLVTLAEEPALVLKPGERAPDIDPADLAAARLRCAWMVAEMTAAEAVA